MGQFFQPRRTAERLGNRRTGKVNRIDSLLAIYLNDHLAGGTFGGELTKRALRSNRGSPVGAFLERLHQEILEDRETLERVMATLGVSRSTVKPMLALAAERAGRLKLNGRVTGYSPLSRVLELEALVAGVTGKRAMWTALRELQGRDTRLSAFDFAQLERRADEQLEELERNRLEAARLAFADGARR